MSTQASKAILISDVMTPYDLVPIVTPSTFLKEALDKMNQCMLGIVCILDNDRKLCGIITDGDIRRKLIKVQKPLSALFVDDVIDHAIQNPIVVNETQSLREAIDIMGEKKIWDLPVVDKNNILVGLLHLHPVVKSLLGA